MLLVGPSADVLDGSATGGGTIDLRLGADARREFGFAVLAGLHGVSVGHCPMIFIFADLDFRTWRIALFGRYPDGIWRGDGAASGARST
jgi:hypothetical protein